MDDTDVQPGLHVLAGAKVFLTKNIALFGEYKFLQTGEFEFKTRGSGTVLGIPATETSKFHGDLTGHHFYAGIALHW